MNAFSHAFGISIINTCIYGIIMNDIEIYKLSLLRETIRKLRNMYYIPFIITFPFAYYYTTRSRFKTIMK